MKNQILTSLLLSFYSVCAICPVARIYLNNTIEKQSMWARMSREVFSGDQQERHETQGGRCYGLLLETNFLTGTIQLMTLPVRKALEIINTAP